MEQNLYKRLLLVFIKYLPWTIAIFYFISIVLSCFDISTIILSNLVAPSVLTLLLMLICSIALNFCIWHRLPLYYVGLVDTINLIDVYWVIPISSFWMLMIYSSLFGITILLGAYLKNRYNVRKRIIKENIK